MRRYLVTSIVAVVAFLGGLGAQSFFGGSATAVTRPVRVYRCISHKSQMDTSAYNLGTRPAVVKVRWMDVTNVWHDEPDATIQPDESNALVVNEPAILTEFRTRGRLLVTGVSYDPIDGDPSVHTVRCKP